MKIGRNKHYLEVMDADGCRHLVRISSIQWLSDSDACRNETLLTAAGRTVHVPFELDVVRRLIEPVFPRSDETSRKHRSI
jgi:hypothetical protein